MSKPHWRDCLASEVPGASCQFPQCDCSLHSTQEKKKAFKMPTTDELLAANAQFGPLDHNLLALGRIVEWWDGLPQKLRQSIEGSGGEPGCIAHARRLVTRP